MTTIMSCQIFLCTLRRSILMALLVLYLFMVFSIFHPNILTPSSNTVPCEGCTRVLKVTSLPVALESKGDVKVDEPIVSETAKIAKNNDTVVNPALTFVSHEKIDWNNYELIANDTSRQGPGEQGKAFTSTIPVEEKMIIDQLLEKYRYNVYASDYISLERSIGDLRPEACKTQTFLKDIPTDSVSVITVFHDERNTTLLRTVHSIVNRSPASLLKEVILVDDFNTNEDLMAPLDEYIAQHFPKVRVLRNQVRLGLIKSRMVGAAASSGKFLLFLDAHIEVNHNYLPPLLEPVILNYRTIACPQVDVIDKDSLEIHPLTNRIRGAFDWDLCYKRLPVDEAMDETTPHPSPVMVGCAFAISRQWWEELGQYDSGLQIWGAEQYELSFKSWQCGGSVMDAPCSRVAHLFRPIPYLKELLTDDVIEKNFQRLSSVWMDEYKDYVLRRRPRMKEVGPGNLTKQFEIRRRLNCKSFKWFMEVVAPDIPKYYPLIPPPFMAWGQIRNKFNSSVCVEVMENGHFKLDDCVKKHSKGFVYDWRLHIRETWKKCFANPAESVYAWNCVDIERKPTQNFLWNLDDGHLINMHTKLCVDVDTTTLELNMKACNGNIQTQAWTFDGYNTTLVKESWDKHSTKIHV